MNAARPNTPPQATGMRWRSEGGGRHKQAVCSSRITRATAGKIASRIPTRATSTDGPERSRSAQILFARSAADLAAERPTTFAQDHKGQAVEKMRSSLAEPEKPSPPSDPKSLDALGFMARRCIQVNRVRKCKTAKASLLCAAPDHGAVRAPPPPAHRPTTLAEWS